MTKGRYGVTRADRLPSMNGVVNCDSEMKQCFKKDGTRCYSKATICLSNGLWSCRKHSNIRHRIETGSRKILFQVAVNGLISFISMPVEDTFYKSIKGRVYDTPDDRSVIDLCYVQEDGKKKSIPVVMTPTEYGWKYIEKPPKLIVKW